jgi:starvation-inducible DNA-binding protein
MEKFIECMKRLFATNYQYYVKAHGFHVNVVGPDFVQYHQLFGEVYELADDATDTIGEHIRVLQAIAPFSLKRIMELGTINDSTERPDAMKMVK